MNDHASHTTFARRLLITGLLAFAAVMLAATTAFAGHQDLQVEFTELQVHKQAGRVLVDYTIKPRHWRELRRRGIEPRLNLYTARPARHSERFEFAYSVVLTKRTGRLTMPPQVKVRGVRTVEVRLVGFSGPYRIDRIRLGRDCGERLQLHVSRSQGRHDRGYDDHDDHDDRHRDGRHHDRHHARHQAELIEACKKHSRFSSDFEQCLERARRLPVYTSVATVEACGRHSRFSSDLGKCLDAAARFRHDPSPAIEACGKHSRFSSDLERCLDTASGFRFHAAPAIEACGEHSRHSSKFRQCLEDVAHYRTQPARIIRACGEHTRFDSEFRSCLKSSRDV